MKSKEYCKNCDSEQEFVFYSRWVKDQHHLARCKNCKKVYKVEDK